MPRPLLAACARGIALGLLVLAVLFLLQTNQPGDEAHADPIGVIALNPFTCVWAGVAFERVHPNTIGSFCLPPPTQERIQDFARCLLSDELDEFGFRVCQDDSGTPLRLAPDDFARMDVDGNRVHRGASLLVLAFVDTDDPVTITASMVAGGEPWICDAEQPRDPDCDGDPETVGDGVVAMQLIIPSTADPGEGFVEVSQSAVTHRIPVFVTGPPVEVELTFVGGRDTIHTSGEECGFFEEDIPEPDIDDLAALFAAPPTSLARTAVFAQAVDAWGNDVVGTWMDWSPGETPTGTLPSGNVITTATLYFGDGQIGAVNSVCGGAQAGEFELEVRRASLFGTGFWQPVNLTINVIDPPTPTSTPTSTPTPTPTPVPTATPEPACLVHGQKISMVVNISLRLGTSEGDRLYQPRFDVNNDGVIDAADLEQILSTPVCEARAGRSR